MRKTALILLICFFCTGRCLAASKLDELTREQGNLIGSDTLIRALPDDALELYDGFNDVLNADLSEGVQQILSTSLAGSGTTLRLALRSAAALLAVSLLTAVIGIAGLELPQKALTVGSVLAVTLLAASDLKTMVGLGAGALQEVTAFSDAMLPVLAAATAATGVTSAAGALYIGTIFFTELLTNLLTRVFLPLVDVCLALACAEKVSGYELLGRIRKTVQWCVSLSLKALLIVFTAYLSVTAIVSGSADSISVKAAKLALSNLVPVVGSTIGDISETVLVSAGILKSAVGVFGLLGVLAICVIPFLRLGIHYLTLKTAAALSSSTGAADTTGMIDAAADCMGMLLGMIGAASLFNLIACVCFIKVVLPV